MVSVVQLGTVTYEEGLRLQKRLVGLRKSGEIGDVLLLLEHTPVITLGRNAKAANVLVGAEQLAARGIEVFECDRGGDVTFHGPGQMVGYPIIDLRGFERSSQFSVPSSQSNRNSLGVVDYVRSLEEVLIRTCADFGVAAERVAGLTGVWTETQGPSTASEAQGASDSAGDDRVEKADNDRAEAKIAAIGVHISRSVTSHGFALNVNTDLSYFNLIVPCGIAAKPVTSMQRKLGRDVEMNAVAQSLSRNFGNVFGREMLWVDTIDALLGNTVGVPMKPPSDLRSLRAKDDVVAT
jgi:lipoyl(octanoyl) transferase